MRNWKNLWNKEKCAMYGKWENRISGAGQVSNVYNV